MKKETQDKLNLLKNKYYKIGSQIRQLEEEETVNNALPALRKLVGQCFKYRNSYGVGSNKPWWSYCKVVSIDEKTTTFTCVEFQKTTQDMIEVGFTKRYSWGGRNPLTDGYIKISNPEYNKAKKVLYKFLDKTLSPNE